MPKAKKQQTVCGIRLPAGLVESSQLPEPIFTPSTKAETGHDENISFVRAAEILGQPLAEKVRDHAIAITPPNAASSSPTRNSSSAWPATNSC